MGKKKEARKKVSINIKSLTAPARNLSAVFADADGGYEVFPVIMFAVFDLGETDDSIGGLISGPDGLWVADHDDAFIGFKYDHQENDEFLEDHGYDPNDRAADDDDEDEGDDDDD